MVSENQVKENTPTEPGADADKTLGTLENPSRPPVPGRATGGVGSGPIVRRAPSIGRIVHYFHQEWQGRDKENPCSTLPAIIIAVHSEKCVDLQVIRNDGQNGGLMHRVSVNQGGPGTIGTWFWPDMV